jgi:hypothetical protein
VNDARPKVIADLATFSLTLDGKVRGGEQVFDPLGYLCCAHSRDLHDPRT